jgi:hypothetical protein
VLCIKKLILFGISDAARSPAVLVVAANFVAACLGNSNPTLGSSCSRIAGLHM